MATSISQLPSASKAEIVDGAEIIINTTDNETKTTTLDTLRSNYFGDLRVANLLIASADVLTLNATPIEIVAAQGVGTYIEVLSSTVRIKYNSVAYATNTTLQLINSGAGAAQYELDCLAATVDTGRKMGEITTTVVGKTQLVDNTALMVQVSTGDPTAGDSDIELFIAYRVITL